MIRAQYLFSLITAVTILFVLKLHGVIPVRLIINRAIRCITSFYPSIFGNLAPVKFNLSESISRFTIHIH